MAECQITGFLVLSFIFLEKGMLWSSEKVEKANGGGKNKALRGTSTAHKQASPEGVHEKKYSINVPIV